MKIRNWGVAALLVVILGPGVYANDRVKLNRWPYYPLQDSPLPKVADSQWPRSSIDHFVLAALEREGLKPAPPASPRVLVRRIHFDLIGMPPSPEVVAAFERDAAVDLDAAIERLADELLASPHYGEQWGRHWLDVARYAEDQAHSSNRNASAFRYRDWVAHAFNSDLPFDQFVRRQIAGDLLPTPEKDDFDQRFERLGGLGFFGLGAVYYKNSDKAQAMADELDDRIDTFSRGFLGLTVSCARCHDHKFDPISIEDYYSVAGIFNGTRPGTVSLATRDVVDAHNRAIGQVKEQEKVISRFLQERGRIRSGEELSRLGPLLTLVWKLHALEYVNAKFDTNQIADAAGFPAYFVRRWLTYARQNGDRLPKEFYELFSRRPDSTPSSLEGISVPRDVEERIAGIAKRTAEAKRRHDAKDESPSPEGGRLLQGLWLRGDGPFHLDAKNSEKLALDDAGRAELKTLRDRLAEVQGAVPPPIPKAPFFSGNSKAMQVFLRGDPAKPGPWVARGFLDVLDPGARPEEEGAARGRDFSRMDLADAIASPKNPLTVRVFVNRIWQWRFGRGIVATSSNFGELGERPTHPELLDWLAKRFLENGQSVKWLHRQMITSASYRLSSSSVSENLEIDADNRWLWRWRARRLNVESMRDSLLAVSGELDSRVGGPSQSVLDRGNLRRTIYAQVSRHQPSDFLRLFDFPDANVTAAERLSTIVPQQQLFALNSDFLIDRAKAFAKRVVDGADTDEGRVSFAYRLAFSRKPKQRELKLALDFLSTPPQDGDALSPWVQYAQALLATNEFLYVD